MAEERFQAGFGVVASDCAIIQFEGWDDVMPSFEAALADKLGGALPRRVGETTAHENGRVVRVSSRRFWLLSNGAASTLDVESGLGSVLPLTEGRVRLRLSGRNIKHVLERCVAVDWDGIADGQAAHASFHGVPVLLLRNAPDQCDILAPRSFARSLVEWISDVEIGCRDRRDHLAN
jgi:sarcosine oxidase subunit gamma